MVICYGVPSRLSHGGWKLQDHILNFCYLPGLLSSFRDHLLSSCFCTCFLTDLPACRSALNPFPPTRAERFLSIINMNVEFPVQNLATMSIVYTIKSKHKILMDRSFSICIEYGFPQPLLCVLSVRIHCNQAISL